MKIPIILAWSGGKDSTLALQALLSGNEYDIISLLTTVTEDYDRISMHGVRRALLVSQAEALGLPLDIIRIPGNASNEDYGRAMGMAMARWKERGVSTVAFGDIHLLDVRKYREENLMGAGMKALFPLWGEQPDRLMRHFIESGFRAVVTCVDTDRLDGSFAGGRWTPRSWWTFRRELTGAGKTENFTASCMTDRFFNGR